MRKDTLYITLSRDITSYTITSGQRAIATNVNYTVTIESPTLTTNLAGRDVSVIISDTEGNTLTTATTFYPDTKNPYKAVTGSLLLDGAVYSKFFDGKPVDTAVRLPIVIRDKSATLLSSDIVVMNGGENAEPSASDETVAGLVNAIRFYDLAEFKAWIDGTLTRDDGLLPTDIVVGQWVHTQNDGSFICRELIGAGPSVEKNFTAIVTQFPLTGTLKMNPDNGIGLSVYSGDVYNEADATSYSIGAITYKGEEFTFKTGDDQIARQKDNYALENRVNNKMNATLEAIKADNDETYNDMLPVMNTTVEARNRAETAASNAKASETRAITAETNAATSERNAKDYSSVAVTACNLADYSMQRAQAYAQKAESCACDAKCYATKAENAACSACSFQDFAMSFSASARDYRDQALIYRNAAEKFSSCAKDSASNALSSEIASSGYSCSACDSADKASSSECNAHTYSLNAKSYSDQSCVHMDSALNFADAAARSAAASAASAKSSTDSADAAAKSATEAASQVTDTLKRINFCNGKFYSQYYNASSRSITLNEKFNDACLMAWNDRYIIITDALKVGWTVVNGSDFSFISSSPYHHSAYLYAFYAFNCLGFNGSRVAIFYRFDEYKEGGTTCNYAEVLDANTGEVLIEKTYTAEDMAFIKAAPCFGMAFTCILKNGDMIHRGTIFSGEDLSIRGYVAAEDGFAVVRGSYSTYCCYLTANADNSYSGEDPIIVQSNDTYSFWVDDRYTLGEDGEPIVTLRNFHVDGIFNETNSDTRRVAVLFSVYSQGWGGIHHVAAVRNPLTGKISLRNVSLDITNDNIIAFSSGSEIDYAQNIYDLVPVNFRTGGLIYAHVPFYVVRGALVYAVRYNSIASSPCIALQANDKRTRPGGPYFTASVAYTNGNHSRPIPVSRFFFNNSSLIYPVENI